MHLKSLALMEPRHVQFNVIITFFPIWRLISAPSSLCAEQTQWQCNNHLGIFSPLFIKVALEWWLRIISASYLHRVVLHYTYCIPYITVLWNLNQTPCIKRPSLDVKSRLGFIKTFADKAAFRHGKRKKKNKATHSMTQLLTTRFNILHGHFDDIQARFAQWSVPNKRADWVWGENRACSHCLMLLQKANRLLRKWNSWEKKNH